MRDWSYIHVCMYLPNTCINSTDVQGSWRLARPTLEMGQQPWIEAEGGGNYHAGIAIAIAIAQKMYMYLHVHMVYI